MFANFIDFSGIHLGNIFVWKRQTSLILSCSTKVFLSSLFWFIFHKLCYYSFHKYEIIHKILLISLTYSKTHHEKSISIKYYDWSIKSSTPVESTWIVTLRAVAISYKSFAYFTFFLRKRFWVIIGIDGIFVCSIV